MFNTKIDADVIVASLMRKAGTTLGDNVNCGVTFVPHGQAILEKPIGYARTKNGVIRAASNFMKLTTWQRDYARRLVQFLNYELHHDGVWSVAWSNPTHEGMPTQLNFAFQDVDGDIQCVVNSDRTLIDLMTKDDVKGHGGNAEAAYQHYVTFVRDVDVKKNQTIKAAQGEQQLDPNVVPII